MRVPAVSLIKFSTFDDFGAWKGNRREEVVINKQKYITLIKKNQFRKRLRLSTIITGEWCKHKIKVSNLLRTTEFAEMIRVQYDSVKTSR